MSILVNKNSKVICQGLTGRQGSFHAEQCIEYGTQIVAGVTPGRGGVDVEGIPVFDTVTEAREKHGANATMIFVPAPFAADAVEEAAEAGIELIICITEGIPALDEARMKRVVTAAGARMIGPNCPGLISPGKSKVGILPGNIHMPGNVGLVSRSGTLTYQVVDHLTRAEMGQSTCIGIGGDPIIGTNFVDTLERFEADDETESVVMIGEIGGTDEEAAAAYVKNHVSKPVAGFIAGRTAPPGKRMGHAGAIIEAGGKGTAESKIEAMQSAGITVAESPADMGEAMAQAMGL